MTVLLQK